MLKYFIPIISFFLIITGCSTSYIKALQFGDVSSEQFMETVHIESINQLVIIPVTIEGKTYRFLFDTGAPFSVSDELHNTHAFKTLNKATLTDSDKSRSSLEIVQVDKISIGNIDFTNQTAFVASFKQNAILSCLNIDGIVGSNMMRFCNWTIDMQSEIITLSKGHPVAEQDAFTSIPFRKNVQYDMIVDAKVGKTTIQDIKIDYGSNGSLTLPGKTFSRIKEHEFNDSSLVYNGFVQAGLFGVRKPFTAELVRTDSLYIHTLLLENISIKSGKSALLGGKILSNYIVNINWENETISFAKHVNQYCFDETFGVKVGVHEDKFVVQSILEGSPAYHHGIKPNMEIIKIDNLDFSKTHTICDYIDHFKEDRKSVHFVYKTLEGDQKELTLTKKSPY